MIGATTTVELSSTGIDGDDSDVFSSLRDGVSGEDLLFGIGETVADSVEQFDLVAVASGEAELPSTEKVSASIGQTACATCVGCPFLSQCVKPQALVMKQESERQENVSDDMNSADEEAIPNLLEMTPKQSYLDRLLAPDDFDSLDENGRGELVLAGYSESTDYQEPIIKKAPEPVVSEAKPIDLTTKTNKSTEKLIPQEREDKTSTNQAVEASGEDVDIEAVETPFFELKTAPEIAADDTTDAGEALSESTSEISGEGHFTETAEASSPSIEVKSHVIDAISDAAHNDNKKPTPESLDATLDYNNSVESTDIVDNERLVDTAIVDEAKVDPPNEEIDILAADQIFTDTQVLSIEQLDYSGTAIERSHGKDNDFWAEEDAVFFIERQESSVVESEASSAETVTIALPVETITVREETDDSEPVEQVIISTSPIIEPTLDVESDEVATKIPEECLVLREEFVKISEKSDLLRSDDEIESVIMDVSDIKSGINLSGEQAELNDILDDCVYNGEESVANGDDLLMNTHPSSGLWSDDSPLNPEEGLVTMTQSAADDSSLVSRLVGVLVVAMCVARGRQARAIPNS
ncbi:hypothetical protein KOY49_04570 [Candidatus Minimicrobia vallesae]|uniref:Uncharacterized protein n=1 Tax=Candidatus Minimicrobia vallesae TaxID=2841264 RepID=A0A8F1SAW5_9BACT|nr:hypothetical protein [Candidatus Minimicrobia vallesae]QWQ31394.1 hypothetical protein KOY49_04570 [Candidatus Minimicrobia vallesae]